MTAYVGLLMSMLPWRVTPLIYGNLSTEGSMTYLIKEANLCILNFNGSLEWSYQDITGTKKPLIITGLINHVISKYGRCEY